MNNYTGSCFCGHIKFSCNSDPFFTQYCHCNKCREIAALSKRDTDRVGYAWTAAYLTSHFKITEGENNLDAVIRNNSTLYLCQFCQSLIYGISLDISKQAGVGVNANNFQFSGVMPDSFKPVRHIWYPDRVADFSDDLPKFKDAPKEQFGSGEIGM